MTTTPVRYSVIFKDGPHEVPLMIGPFVSMSDAENFKRELPRPMPGGKVTVRPIYSHGTLPLVKGLIEKDRRERTTRPKAEQSLHA